MGSHANGGTIPSPYVEVDRNDWARLREEHPMHLDEDDIERLRGLGERLDLAEVEQVYLPISRLLSFYEQETARLHKITSEFLDESPKRTPFIIGVAGSVAVGKSTTARILAELIRRWDTRPSVELVTTDGFLYPNAVLTKRNLMARKGFPESYDRRALLKFVAEVKAGKAEVSAPVYSHLVYDIVPDERIVVRQPDVLVVEGLNVLQPPQAAPSGRASLAVSDFFDFSVYVDAHVADIKRWFLDRFLSLRQTAFADPESHFHRYASLTDDAAVDIAENIWESINAPNLVENILPTRSRATLVLLKGPDHTVDRVRLRRL
ncbi:type I pantothenate kinase [Ornithinimicrobium panacihumi]|uniref:type I pantothenate kinase n=1 Tax=Ornithinimicrobium panacihumi TaxID=2008449 RepID=UPI003F8A886C